LFVYFRLKYNHRIPASVLGKTLILTTVLRYCWAVDKYLTRQCGQIGLEPAWILEKPLVTLSWYLPSLNRENLSWGFLISFRSLYACTALASGYFVTSLHCFGAQTAALQHCCVAQWSPPAVVQHSLIYLLHCTTQPVDNSVDNFIAALQHRPGMILA
jgi:hypothetical protein